MEYKVINRPKLSRNKYGEVDDKEGVSGGNSYFSSTSSNNSGGSGVEYKEFVGSTATQDGKKGLVPAPQTNNDEPLIDNDNQKFLKGTGAWVDIPISRYTEENVNKDGINLNGNFTVSDTLTANTLNVLGSAHFWELVIDKVKATGGNLLITPASFKVDYVGDVINYNVDATQSPFNVMFYNQSQRTGILGLQELFTNQNVTQLKGKRLYMKRSDGDNQIVTECQIGDMVRCKTLNIDDSGSEFSNKDYWTFVLGTGTQEYQGEDCLYIDVLYQYVANGTTYGAGTTITYQEDYIEDSGSSDEPLLDSFTFGYGDFDPEVGDDLVCLGHLWNGERQGAILISAYDPMDPELKAPAIAQYMGIRTFTTLSPYRVSSIAANGNTFMGKFLVNYNGTFMDIDEKLNLYTADITTGLEKVGIHLDGENSTIKLIGSTEIRQNTDGVVDTLTVWDSDDIMRVKISPESIPNKSNIQQEINPTSSLQFRNNGTSNNYGVTVHHTWTEFIWSWDHRWQYYVSTGGYIKFFQYCNIGTFQSGSKITLSNLYTSLTSRAYFKGGDKITTRSTSGRTQSITDVIIRLKRKSGSSYVNVTSKTLTSGSTITVSDESATISYPNSIWDNYNIGTTGSYRIELEFVYNPYASITYTSEQSNPSIDFYNNLWSTINIVQPSASMTRIGRNGLVFNTDQSGQYFYAGNGGIEMKWGDVGISLDSSYGFRQYKKTYTVNTSGTSSSYYQYSIPVDADVIFVTGSYVRLITTASSNIPEGKDLIVVGNSSTSYGSANIVEQSISVSTTPDAEGFYHTASGSFSKVRKHFIWHNLEWWEI